MRNRAAIEGRTILRRAARWGLVHRNEPLVRQHGLNDLSGAAAARHHQLVFLHFDQQAQGFEVGDHLLACHKTVQAQIGSGRLIVDLGVQRQHADEGQLVALADGVIVLVVRWGDLDHTRAKSLVHVVVGNHRNGSIAQRQGDVLAKQVPVALILGVHHGGHVAQHGLRPRCGHHQTGGHFAVDELRAIGEWIADVPQKAVFFFALDFQVADRAHQHRVPVDQALAAVDQTLLIELDKGLSDGFGQLVVHREVLAAPVHAVAHAAHLGRDGVAAFLFPLPDLGDKVLAAQVVAADFLLLQLALDHDLCGNAGMVGTRNPGRIGAEHAVIARQRIHDGLVEGMAHVQRARHIGRWQLDGKGGRALFGHLAAAIAGLGVTPAFPLGAPLGLNGGGLERFGQAVQAGLLGCVIHDAIDFINRVIIICHADSSLTR